ncbi:MAG: glycosyltransferase family 4 protein [Patescibacteria group bacterium]
MKILQLNKYYWPKGGADRYMLEVSALLESRGHQILPFAMAHPQNLPSVYGRYFVSSVTTDRVVGPLASLKTFGRMLYSFEAKRNLADLISRERPDVAHVHNIYTQISPSVLDLLYVKKIPVVMTVHDYHLIMPNFMMWDRGCTADLSKRGLIGLTMSRFHQDSYLASFAQALAFKFHRSRKSYELAVKKFIAPSLFMRDQLLAHGFDAKQIVHLPHFVELADKVPEYNDRGYVLYIGRLTEEKGVEVLLRAMEGLPGVPCKIVGTGPEEATLHIMGDRLPNVTFEGYQSGEALWNYIRGARAVVVPSVWNEVFGLVALEAMAFGKPVIASEVGALPEVVIDGHTGFLVPPADVHALREAISRLAEDPLLATKMGRNGRSLVEQKYTVATHYLRLMEVYRDAMG